MHERLQGQMRLGGLQADKQDTEYTLAGLNPMLRVSGLHPKVRLSGLHPMLRQRDPAARLIVCFCMFCHPHDKFLKKLSTRLSSKTQCAD